MLGISVLGYRAIGTEGPMVKSSTEIENDACRRIMISLYGSEEKAIAAARALLGNVRPVEEALTRRRYRTADRAARQVAARRTRPSKRRAQPAC